MPCENHGPKCNGNECANKNLDNGLMTRLWGPSGWLFLHCVSFGYPYKINPRNQEHIEKQNDYYRFFYYLGKVLPCKYCRISYMEYFTKHSPMNKLETRKDFTKWLYDVHNMVNEKLGVPECEIPSFEEIEDIYQSFRASCKPLTTKEKDDKEGKGCITPEDGMPKRCVIKVVEYEQKSEIREPLQSYPKSDDYFIISKKNTYCIIIIILLIPILYYFYYRLKFKK